MKSVRLILEILLVFLTNTVQADILSFDGSLTGLTTQGDTFFTQPAYTGQINYDTVIQAGSANFDQVLFNGFYLDIHDVALTQTGGTIHANGLWDWGVVSDNVPISWDWAITALSNGAISLALLDTDNDGTPGTAMTSGPFVGFTFAIEGVASPVPVPAAAWLFVSGLIGLLGVGWT